MMIKIFTVAVIIVSVSWVAWEYWLWFKERHEREAEQKIMENITPINEMLLKHGLKKKVYVSTYGGPRTFSATFEDMEFDAEPIVATEALKLLTALQCGDIKPGEFVLGFRVKRKLTEQEKWDAVAKNFNKIN